MPPLMRLRRHARQRRGLPLSFVKTMLLQVACGLLARPVRRRLGRPRRVPRLLQRCRGFGRLGLEFRDAHVGLAGMEEGARRGGGDVTVS